MERHCHRGRAAGVRLGISLVQIDTLAPSHLNTAINGPGVVACEAEEKKRAKYASQTPTFCFVPVAVATLESLGDSADELMHDLGRCISEVIRESVGPQNFCCKDSVLPFSAEMQLVC
jgi:hypothetical protein